MAAIEDSSAADSASACCPICDTPWHWLGVDPGTRDAHALACLANPHSSLAFNDDEADDEDLYGLEGRHAVAALNESEYEQDAARDKLVPCVIPALHSLLVRSYLDSASSFKRATITTTSSSSSGSSSSTGSNRVRTLLCDTHTSAAPSTLRDWGWACGYKNLLVCVSHARFLRAYSPATASTSSSSYDPTKVPRDIPGWQEALEEAWRQGFDPVGAQHFKGQISGSKKWIGAADVCAVLSSLGFRTKLINFPADKSRDVAKAVLSFVRSHFDKYDAASRDVALERGSASASSISPSLSKAAQPARHDAFSVLLASGGKAKAPSAGTVTDTSAPPLFLQHQGHSRTIVGIEIRPASSDRKPAAAAASLVNPKARLRKAVQKVGFDGGTNSEAEKDDEDEVYLIVLDSARRLARQVRDIAEAYADATTPSSSPPPSRKAAKHHAGASPHVFRDGKTQADSLAREIQPAQARKLCAAFKVSPASLGRKDEYQILFVDPVGPPLSHAERLERKTVTSARM